MLTKTFSSGPEEQTNKAPMNIVSSLHMTEAANTLPLQAHPRHPAAQSPPKRTCRSATAPFSSSAVIFRLSQEQIDRLWDDYDKDGNGSLDKDEAHAFFRDVLYRMKVIFEF